MAQDRFPRQSNGDVSPYLERPLRTLAQAELDRQSSPFFRETGPPVPRDSRAPPAQSPTQDADSFSREVKREAAKK